MTPRNPWRRNWHDKLILVLLTLPAFLIIGGALGLSIARAETPSPGQRVADEHAADVCMLLDAHPTVGGVIDVMDILQSDGLSRREAGVALVESIAFTCPIHADLLQKLMDRAHERSVTA